jgi:hypothetical protein
VIDEPICHAASVPPPEPAAIGADTDGREGFPHSFSAIASPRWRGRAATI